MVKRCSRNLSVACSWLSSETWWQIQTKSVHHPSCARKQAPPRCGTSSILCSRSTPLTLGAWHAPWMQASPVQRNPCLIDSVTALAFAVMCINGTQYTGTSRGTWSHPPFLLTPSSRGGELMWCMPWGSMISWESPNAYTGTACE